MWDQRAPINVSEGSERISGSNLSSLQDKKIFESSGGDSGFISGPQNSSDCLDSETDIREDTDAPPKQTVDNFEEDSGVFGTKETTQDSMIFRQGDIDVGLSEWMCKVNLKDSTVNDLNSSRKTVEEPKPTKITKQLLWEICYVQDADGDT